MLQYFISSLILIFVGMEAADGFKTQQLRYARVREAYANKEKDVNRLLEDKELSASQLNLCLRAFKQEKILELWGKNTQDSVFKLIKTYAICRTSGELGPKRKQGDLQIPEGFYHIDRFNPVSSYYLSLGINYPNASDRILGNKGNLGGDIFIHGDCVTIGCIPITDDWIKELYVFCVEAKSNGQHTIPVTIFPFKMEDQTYQTMVSNYDKETQMIGLWTDLKTASDLFAQSHNLPTIKFLETGRHKVE
jgi:murein L,D-transpeptidase YafK